ncbi:ABC transporter ATP-binding protein [Vibrio coralliilyticus]|uniref:ABC transporter ATP-binding protein n=1 Tax=Vibrio coralliilyticus TaxID=190893 RepID=UPI00148CAA44|nr:ABC transporter ATP-binding protein [Vibrio coralliilyticus]NOI30450.1 ABC transporter ATP-binding protein [Vibrio coralliilyticus]NOI50038.1 ABC transporter ATP-binding protein [Vibrio coralliilyticus]
MYRALSRILEDTSIRHFQVYLLLIFLYSIIQGLALMMLAPILTELFRNDIQAVERHLMHLTGLVIIGAILHYAHTMSGFKLAMVVLNNAHRRLGDHLMTLPMGWFTSNKIGRLSRTASGGTLSITNIFVRLLFSFVSGVVTPLTIATMMMILDWRLGLTALFCIPILYLAHRWSARWISKMEKHTDQAGVEASNRVVEFARNQHVLRTFDVSKQGYWPLEQAIEAQTSAGGAMLAQTLPRLLVSGGLVQVMYVVLAFVGVTLSLQDALPPAELIAFLALAARFTGPLAELAGRSGMLKMAFNDLDRLTAVLESPSLPEPKEPPSLTRIGEIVFSQVHFHYPQSPPVFSGLSLTIPNRTMTAIVGPSGSGKTSVIRLVLRYFDVQQGQVSVGGIDVRQQTLSGLMAQVSVVMQKVYLFDDTLEANVRLGRPNATETELREAIALSGLDKVTARLPNGKLTKVGEAGHLLSGGEKQRVSIARAILKRAPIIIMDEATSALDPENEAIIRHAMTVLKTRSTLIVIAHHLPSIVDADQIIVMDKGRIHQQGDHQNLVNETGLYRTLWDKQKLNHDWRMTR